MNLRNISIGFAALAVTVLCSCDKRNFGASEGSVQIAFSIDPAIIISSDAPQSKAATLPSLDNFTITINADNGSITPITFRYADRPEVTTLEPGAYTITCALGDPNAPHSETPVYFSSKSHTFVNSSDKQTVTLAPERTHLCFDVCYGAGFENYYSDYKVRITADQLSTPVDFATNGQNTTHYFKKGSLYQVALIGTKTDGGEATIALPNILPETPKNYHRFNISFNGPEFDQTNTTAIELTETVSATTPHQIAFHSFAPLNNELATLALEFKNPELAALSGSYTLNLETIATLAQHGIICALEDYKGKITFSQTLTDQMLSMNNTATTNSATISITDKNGKAASQTATFTVNPPEFTLPDPNPADIWCMEATHHVLTAENITRGNPDLILGNLSYSISRDNGATFTPLVGSNNKLFANNLPSSPTGADYIIRASYRNGAIHVERTFQTAPKQQIPNSNFAANYSTNGGNPCYWFFADGASGNDQWWATRNPMTTGSGAGYHYCQYSGARPASPGVELVTCGWGTGNTASGSWSVINNVSAGAIFLGSFSESTEKHGKQFSTRPTALNFQYKYAPYNSNDRCVAKIWIENRDGDVPVTIGNGEFTTTQNVGNYTSNRLNITYTNTTLAPTHLCIAFYSGVNEGSENVKKPGFTKNEPSRGSVMYVNDVELIYEK